MTLIILFMEKLKFSNQKKKSLKKKLVEKKIKICEGK
jgi:hypothetical protein